MENPPGATYISFALRPLVMNYVIPNETRVPPQQSLSSSIRVVMFDRRLSAMSPVPKSETSGSSRSANDHADAALRRSRLWLVQAMKADHS